MTAKLVRLSQSRRGQFCHGASRAEHLGRALMGRAGAPHIQRFLPTAGEAARLARVPDGTVSPERARRLQRQLERNAAKAAKRGET